MYLLKELQKPKATYRLASYHKPMRPHTKKKKEAKDWLDYPENRSWLLRCFYWLCGLIVVVDVVFTLGWHKHAIFKEGETSNRIIRQLLWEQKSVKR